MAHALTWLDVFTDRPLTGNGLAVVSPRRAATATAVPSDGWPAIGSSPVIIHIRLR